MRIPLHAPLVAVFVICAGCTGNLSPPRSRDGLLAPSSSETAGSGAVPLPPTGTVPSPEVACKAEPTVGASIMRRQTNTEYIRNVRSLLGASEAGAVDLPGESTVNNFENVPALQSISEQHVTQFDLAVSKFLASSLTSATSREALVGCSPSGTGRDVCLRTFATKFGRRVFRRPLSDPEISRVLALGAVAKADLDPYASVVLIARGLLGASSSLFLVEIGAADPVYPARTDYLLLAPYELAARAAFLAWGSGPDEWLLDAAATGQLNNAAGLAKMAEHLVSDARARTGQQDFFHRWLRLRDVQQAQRDPALFPEWNDGLKASMIGETERLVDHLAWTQGGDFRELLSTKFSFLDARLAAFYGIQAPPTDWQRVELPLAAHRFGLLTHASILTATGRIKARAILRGKFIQEALLCRTMPGPPADIPPLENAIVPADASDRDKLVAHRTNPACSGCHQRLDPVGFGLDNYDSVGKYTHTDSVGQVVDATGTLAGFQPEAFSGPYELALALQNSDVFSNCIPRQLFRWATARPDTREDECAVAQLWTDFKTAKYDYRTLLSALLQSAAFRHRNTQQP